MRQIHFITILSFTALTLSSCGPDSNRADGYGNFEATEITISAESNGKLLLFNVEEGQELKAKTLVGYIDTLTFALKREQLVVTKEVIASKSRGVLSQIDVLKARLETAETNKKRTEILIKDSAGTQKQLDDINGEIAVIKQQIRSVEIQNAPVVNELRNIDVQIRQVEDQIEKSKIINPVNGTVLAKYMEPNEVTTFGKPLYKSADLSTMQLRVFISETQLSNIKIGQEVHVRIDSDEDMKAYPGTITWISSEAEFTPKIIQTKEERVALVYAVKISVKNDGSLKIGMPGEMWLQKP